MDGLSALVHPGQFVMSFIWIGINWVLWVLMYFVTVAQLALKRQSGGADSLVVCFLWE